MAIITSAVWASHTGIVATGADATSVTNFAAAIDAAIRRVIYPFRAEPETITDEILDAPIGNILQLTAVPVRSITSLYLKLGANGDPAAFTATDLLTPFTEYYLPIEDVSKPWNRSGHVYRRGASLWGYEPRRSLGRLAADVDPSRGAIKASYLAGPASGVPADIVAAAVLAVTYLYMTRNTLIIPTSESWNGYSQSGTPIGAAQGAIPGALSSSGALSLLLPYLTVGIV